MTTYGATARREGKWWIVRIPAIDGLTQARRLSEARTMARDYVAIALDVPASQVEIDLMLERIGNVDVETRVGSIRNERDRAAQLDREASEHTITLAKELAHDEHIPVRDIGAILGVSHQRAAQLVNS